MRKTGVAGRFAMIGFLTMGAWVITPKALAGNVPTTRGAFYAVSVQDLDRAIAWYTEHLGFTLTSKGGNEHRSGALLKRPGTVLELAQFEGAVSRESLKKDLESHQVFGIFKLGFLTDNLDDTFEVLKKANVEIFFPIVNASDGNRTFAIKDPEGNTIQFFGK